MLFYKEWNQYPMSLDQGMLFTEGALKELNNWSGNSLNVYCIDIDVIHWIKTNNSGLIDFSKKFIDVGGGIGEFSCVLEFVENHIFEPSKECLWNCHANLLIHDKMDSSYTYQVALSDYEGECEVFTNNTQKKSTVPCHTLDFYNFDNVGLLKIDVEGMEESVIRGARETLERSGWPPIQFECWDENKNSLFGLLWEYGYNKIECINNMSCNYIAFHV